MKTYDKFFSTVAVMGILILLSTLIKNPQPEEDAANLQAETEALRQAALRTAIDTSKPMELREQAAQAYCGNAGWKFILDQNNVLVYLVCIPKHGKSYKISAPIL